MLVNTINPCILLNPFSSTNSKIDDKSPIDKKRDEKDDVPAKKKDPKVKRGIRRDVED